MEATRPSQATAPPKTLCNLKKKKKNGSKTESDEFPQFQTYFGGFCRRIVSSMGCMVQLTANAAVVRWGCVGV